MSMVVSHSGSWASSSTLSSHAPSMSSLSFLSTIITVSIYVKKYKAWLVCGAAWSLGWVKKRKGQCLVLSWKQHLKNCSNFNVSWSLLLLFRWNIRKPEAAIVHWWKRQSVAKFEQFWLTDDINWSFSHSVSRYFRTKATYGSKMSYLFLRSPGLLPGSHNFLENITADAEGKKQSSTSYKSLDYLLVCLWTSARAELMTGANHGSTSIALPLFTSQKSWMERSIIEPM